MRFGGIAFNTKRLSRLIRFVTKRRVMRRDDIK